jgi:hypothetical protein
VSLSTGGQREADPATRGLLSVLTRPAGAGAYSVQPSRYWRRT